jgi:hypothetical protein
MAKFITTTHSYPEGGLTSDDIGMQVGHTANPEEGNDYN